MERPLLGVRAHMVVARADLREGPRAVRTRVRLLARVRALVHDAVGARGELLRAEGARVRSRGVVQSLVALQVVQPRKGLRAVGARVRARAGVHLLAVALQRIPGGKFPIA